MDVGERCAYPDLRLPIPARASIRAERPAIIVLAILTSRERGIIVVIATNPGANAMVIAEMLHISQSTLRNHLTAIYGKLGVANRLELYAAALTHGLDKPPA